MSAPNPPLFTPESAYASIRAAVLSAPTTALPSPTAITASTASVTRALPAHGTGDASTLQHILTALVPGFNGSSLSSNYYGFVTGGVLPIAEAADNIVSAFDQNAAVHIPSHSVCTTVEYAAVHMLLQLLGFEDAEGKALKSSVDGASAQWHGTFTTGATGANVLGLLCGREAVLNARLQDVSASVSGGSEGPSVGELGVLGACVKAGITNIQILTTEGHSSLYKAASIVGIGRSCVKDVSIVDQPGILDWQLLEECLKEEKSASIVSVSAGDVNTGRFATSGYEDMARLATLCKKYKAWLHVDGAFGLYARALPDTPEFATLRSYSSGLELADSVTGDNHKCLNVPYDSGIFFTRHLSTLTAACTNPNAPYLSSGPSSSTSIPVPSALNIGLENSRRFRALPAYAVLVSHGALGVADILARQVRLARKVAAFIDAHDGFVLLPRAGSRAGVEGSAARKDFSDIHIIVLFRARDDAINRELVSRINASGMVYVSGTVWDGKAAVRVAVSTWKVDVERDFEIVKGVLENALL